MDDIKMFAKNKKRTEESNTIRTYRQDIGMDMV